MNYFLMFMSLLCVIIPHTSWTEILKVKTIFQCHPAAGRTFKKIMMPLLEKNDIQFVDHNEDITLVCGGAGDIQSLQLQSPHIILDEGENASIHRPLLRKAMQNPHLKAVFKNTTLRPKELYNVSKRYHYEIINQASGQQKPFPVEIEKIHTVLWDLHRSAFNKKLNPLAKDDIDYSSPRSVDVFFAGSILFVGKYFTEKGQHRTLLLEKLKTIKNYNIVSQKGHLPKDEFINLLKNTKIAISPWGTAEWCWRDYEAIYCGAVVIKPDTSFVRAVPDLYQNDTYYVACKADFSDLEEKISYILANYDKFTVMRKNARELLINHWDYEKIAYDFAQAIRQVTTSSVPK